MITDILAETDSKHARLALYGRNLEMITILWASTEALVGLVSAYRSGSVSLAGFGWDSLIEVASALAVWWRLSHETDHEKRHRAEWISTRLAGASLLLLATYVALNAVYRLMTHASAEVGTAGILITAAALLAMPFLASQKRRIARALDSKAMSADAKHTDFCAYQAAIVLIGLLMDRFLDISWADAAAALVLVPILVRAGILTLRGQHCCVHG